MKEITISLGSNISPEDNLKEANCLISKKFNNVKFSKIYSSKSEGFDGKDFLNQVILCDTELDFEQVIDLLKKIEVSMGRKKEKTKKTDKALGKKSYKNPTERLTSQFSHTYKNIQDKVFVNMVMRSESLPA